MNGVGARIKSISRRYMGYPYISNPLTGSADVPEIFNDSLKGFDCVTYVESVLALALAGNRSAYPRLLKKIRYEGGIVSWRRRNHFMTQWLRNNVRCGFLQRIGKEAETNRKDRVLEGIPGMPSRRERFSCIPKRKIPQLQAGFQSGDLILFASTRSHLDVFHCGFLVRKGGALLLRHAARSKGGVVEQDLESFLKGNRMAGVILARPVDRRQR